MTHSDTRVLVTGCASGIGHATAKALATKGFPVIASDFDVDGMSDLDAALKLALDLTDPASIDAALGAAGDVDILINNAGVAVWGPVELVPIPEARRLFETHYFGPLRLIQGLLPGMRRRRRGTIVNVTSSGARAPMFMNGTYGSSKMALSVISEMLAFEVAPFGVRVLVIEPGSTVTSMARRRRYFGFDDPDYAPLMEQFRVAHATMQSDHRANPPEVVADVIVDAIMDGGQALYYPTAPDAAAQVEAHESLDWREYQAYMRRVLKVDW